jgi:HD superfamily phosphohydrolase
MMFEPTRALEEFSFLFSQDGGYVRIPIWGHISLARPARRIIEHPMFMHLSRIRQLGFVHYVFPGASHTRFEHSIGTYHLSVLMLQRLVLNPSSWAENQNPHPYPLPPRSRRGNTDNASSIQDNAKGVKIGGTENAPAPKISREEACLFLAAALLHDIGHYPFAHLVDRLPGDFGPAFEAHEDRAKDCILGDTSPGSIYAILRDDWGADPEKVVDVIMRPQESGLPGKMLSGILDPDKMDYLMRDAWACGVPYGNIDTDRLIESLVLDVEGPRHRLGITEKGIAPLESLVFAKYMMFRHIYWHHTVRIAAAMLVRFVQEGLEAGIVDPGDFYRLGDDALLEELVGRSRNLPIGELIGGLWERTLYKRGFTLYPEHAVEEEFALSGAELERVRQLYWDPSLRRRKERQICDLLSQKEGIELRGFEVLLDIPKVNSVFDIGDFKELHVQVNGREGNAFVPFNSHGFTQLTADFAQEFERFSRKVQILCRPDLRDAVARHRCDIKAIVVE